MTATLETQLTAKRAAKAKLATEWIEQLDAEEVEAARDVATVDAYGEYEQHTGFMTALGDELAFPFKAKVMGETLQVTGMEWLKNDEFGLDLLVARNGEQHRMDARSVALVEPFPDGHLTLAAYLKWRRFV